VFVRFSALLRCMLPSEAEAARRFACSPQASLQQEGRLLLLCRDEMRHHASRARWLL